MERSPIIVALDGMNLRAAYALAERLRGLVWGFKVNDLLDAGGVAVVRRLKKIDAVMADPKIYDIGNTVANRVRRYAKAGADLITVAVDAWVPALEAAVRSKGRSKLLAVTELTSMDEDMVRRKYGYPLAEHPCRYPIVEIVLRKARLAKEYALDGLVCSGQELAFLADAGKFKDMLKVVPAIQPAWYQAESNDQKRVMTPREAIDLGADLPVIGRAITKAKDPVGAVHRTLEELKGV